MEFVDTSKGGGDATENGQQMIDQFTVLDGGDATPAGGGGDDGDGQAQNGLKDMSGSGDGQGGDGGDGGGQGGDGGDGGDGGAPDYKTAYSNWAKAKNMEVDASTLPETFGAEDLEKAVGMYYVEKYAPDGMTRELVRSGMGYEAYAEQVMPLLQAANMPARELFIAEETEDRLAKEARLGKFDPADGNAVQARRTALATIVSEEIKDMADENLEAAVKQVREAYKAEAAKVPEKAREASAQAAEQRHKAQVAAYAKEQEALANTIKADLQKGNNYGIPFNGQAEKDGFAKYFKESTAYGAIKVKDPSTGKESEVQDIPFFHKLEDPGYLAKVLRVMYALENGTLTDVKNGIRSDALASLGLEPFVETRQPAGGGTLGRFVDTSMAPMK